MARFGLWVAALSLVCLIAMATSDNVPDTNTNENICGQFFNEGSTMTIARVFDMITIKLRDYVPDFATVMLREFMQYADADHDDRLNQTECENLIAYIKQRTPGQQKK